ncbi:hypothetical protein BRADI_1g28926v3 [Brachypodium distachyon]|uniref:Uncharacterized protein n=1 Tax=Brachypodium distachyon TaxID=15368 RepID=A0A2K2DLS8_BRADI|nr:hypothetical protein BRADI_1g28926v3 [Brachypodium distachyon]
MTPTANCMNQHKPEHAARSIDRSIVQCLTLFTFFHVLLLKLPTTLTPFITAIFSSMVRCFTSKPPIFPTLLGSSSSDRRNLLSFPVAGEEVKDYADWRLGRAGYLSCVWTLEGMTPLGYIASAACGPGRGSCSVKFDDERVLHRHLKFESQVMPPTAHTTGRERRRYQRLRDVCWRYALYSIMS